MDIAVKIARVYQPVRVAVSGLGFSEKIRQDLIARQSDVVARQDDIIARQTAIELRHTEINATASDIDNTSSSIVTMYNDIISKNDAIGIKHSEVLNFVPTLQSAYASHEASLQNEYNTHLANLTSAANVKVDEATAQADLAKAAQADIATRHTDIVAKQQQVATDTQTAVDAKNATLAAAATVTGSVADFGHYDASGHTLPPVPALSGFWKITVAGTLNGIDYGVGDTLVFTTSDQSFYKIDNTESVTSVNGKKGAVAITVGELDGYTRGEVDTANTQITQSLNNYIISNDQAVAQNQTALQQYQSANDAALTATSDSLDAYKASNDAAIQELTNRPVSGGGGGRKNLLINGNFIINQRGFDGNWGALATGVYGYDRWKKHANGIEQIIEGGWFPAGTYYLGWQGGGTGDGQVNGETVGNGGAVEVSDPARNISVVVPADAKLVQFEKGGVTEFGYAHFVNELILCRRYYIYLPPSYYGIFGHSYPLGKQYTATISYDFPVPMRVVPSVIFSIKSANNTDRTSLFTIMDSLPTSGLTNEYIRLRNNNGDLPNVNLYVEWKIDAEL